MKEDLRGMFFIVQGRYERKAPYIEREDGKIYVGGFNPEKDDAEHWYMCVERETYSVVSCSTSLDRVLDSVYNYIIRFQSRKKLAKALKKQRQVEVSPTTVEMYKCVDNYYGDFFSAKVSEQEERAYTFIKENPEIVEKLNKKKKGEGSENVPLRIKPLQNTSIKKIKRLSI